MTAMDWKKHLQSCTIDTQHSNIESLAHQDFLYVTAMDWKKHLQSCTIDTQHNNIESLDMVLNHPQSGTARLRVVLL